jgi:hypothetical protein
VGVFVNNFLLKYLFLSKCQSLVAHHTIPLPLFTTSENPPFKGNKKYNHPS